MFRSDPAGAMRQSWVNLTFLHWRYDPAVVRKLVPSELEVDVFDGAAWVGLVPFGIEDLTTVRGPAVPWLSKFLETNVRTYVVDKHGRRGVWFFSLDAARLPAVVAARVTFGLPYFWAKMRLNSNADRVIYQSDRKAGPAARARIEIETGQKIATPAELDLFLTARLRLFAKRFGKLVSAEVQHESWPLQEARVTSLRENLLEAAGLPRPVGDPLTHFSRRLDVIVHRPYKV